MGSKEPKIQDRSEEADFELSDLSELYGLLRRDAKFLIQDLYSGVSAYRIVAYLLGLMTAFGFALVFVALGSSSIEITPSFFYWALSLVLISCLGAAVFAREYFLLRKKYRQLFETARERLR
ncbi:MAG: hypothetical protein JRN52_05125 [Nitrososphaerota archaeon]|nr:hypothetical protein [Nitrososphaerota archaeon]